MEKNSAKISLGTAICLFIIILLVASLVGMYLYYNKNDVNPIIRTDANGEKVAIEENELTSDLGQNEMFGLININKNTDGTYTLYGGIYEKIDSFSANLSNKGYKKVVVPGDTKYVDYYGNETTIKEIYNGSFPREDNELSAKIYANSTWLLKFEFLNSKCTLIEETNLAA